MSILIRASSTSSWSDCPRRGAARIFPDLIRNAGFSLNETMQTIGASVGTATHAAVAHTMQAKVTTGNLANETETEQCGIEALAESVWSGVRWDDTSPDLNTAEKQVLRQYKSYRLHLADKIQPREIERRITIDTARGNQLSGAVDLADDGIHDLKTGIARRVNVAQYGCYSLLRRSEGQQVEHLTEDYIKRVALNKEQPEPVAITYDREYAEQVAVHIISDIETRHAHFSRTGNPLEFMANPSSQLCSERYCPAFKTNFCMESWGKP